MQARTASRAALLELRNEKQVIEDGHRFLDEKRAMLAHEVLARLEPFAEQLRRFRERERQGAAALERAVMAAGLEGVQFLPPLESARGELVQRRHSFLGTLTVTEASLRAPEDRNPQASVIDPAPTDEMRACAAAFAAVTDQALALATELGNLLRLMHEFQRTQRRVRALENVVLPELSDEESRMEDALEEIDQEDAIRVRLAGRGQGRHGRAGSDVR